MSDDTFAPAAFFKAWQPAQVAAPEYPAKRAARRRREVQDVIAYVAVHPGQSLAKVTVALQHRRLLAGDKEWRRGVHGYKLAARLAVRHGLVLHSRNGCGHFKLWPSPAPVGSEAATAVEIGVEMLVRGLLAIAGWGR